MDGCNEAKHDGRLRRGRTVKLEKVIVARLGSELLGVDNGLLEGIALRGRHCELVVKVGLGDAKSRVVATIWLVEWWEIQD